MVQNIEYVRIKSDCQYNKNIEVIVQTVAKR